MKESKEIKRFKVLSSLFIASIIAAEMYKEVKSDR